MAQSTTNLGKIHVFPSETLYNQFKNLVADNDLALLKDDGAYIIAANLAQNGYVKFSNGLILQWGIQTSRDEVVTLPLAYSKVHFTAYATCYRDNWVCMGELTLTTLNPKAVSPAYWLSIGI